MQAALTLYIYTEITMEITTIFKTYIIILLSIGLFACQRNNEPNPELSPFTVTAKPILGVADLKPTQFVYDIQLTWTKAKATIGDSITYSVVYKDTLAKNLTDTTLIIPNVGNNSTVSGIVIAKSSQGLSASAQFSITVGTAPKFRIKSWSVESSTFRYYTLTKYHYDSLGRLDYFITADAKQCCTIYKATQRTVLKYNQIGQLISVEGLPNGDNTGFYENYLTTYEYDGSGNLTLAKNYSTQYQQPPQKLGSMIQYEYNNEKLPIKATYISSSSKEIDTYTYKNDNLIQIDRTDGLGNSYSSIFYQYDKNPNPFYGLIRFTEYTDFSVTFSKNTHAFQNIITDSNGLIVKKVSTGSNDRTETFEYESY
ncbi:hypothetical protein [Spirosoma foliorum]|uniref:Uncharacterized protein n=1 Tax=Spirosoma foliorum TaxID=2710596 RepID=A0A7G5GYW5_9BACT|nr:hypothetical protein [Spirosoma foliorum]QMW04057.1 hypothetical protein H3H32_03620 [Spirosoma foliorum]